MTDTSPTLSRRLQVPSRKYLPAASPSRSFPDVGSSSLPSQPARPTCRLGFWERTTRSLHPAGHQKPQARATSLSPVKNLGYRLLLVPSSCSRTVSSSGLSILPETKTLAHDRPEPRHDPDQIGRA